MVRTLFAILLLSAFWQVSPARAELQVPQHCMADVRRITDIVSDLEQSTIHIGRGVEPEVNGFTHVRKIQYALKLVESRRPDCFQPVAVSYVTLVLRGDYENPGSSVTSLLPFLYSQGKVKALSQKERARLGGAWLMRTDPSSKAYSLMGAYDCTTSTIHFDPYLAPEDLAASMKHELAHFIQDKLLRFQFSTNLAEQLVLEETLASFVAGAHQLFSHDGAMRGHAPLDNSTAMYDRTLYDRSGNLAQIYRNLRKQEDAFSLDALFDFMSTRPEDRRRFDNIVGIVQKAYFPRSPRATEMKDVFLRLPRKALNPFSLSRQELTRLEQSLQSPTRMCQVFVNAVRSGQLKDYIGSDLPTSAKPGSEGGKPGSEGAKPGSEGGKPGSEGAKPGSEGGKPGSEGAKPGSEGAKPSSILQPCFRPASKF